TLGIPIVSGRVFGAGDDANAPGVGVINRALAEAYFQKQDPIGHVLIAFDTIRVVGIVGDVPIGNLGDKIPPTLYVPFAKWPQTAMAVAVRTSLDVDQTARALRQTIASVDPAAALTVVASMDETITQSPSVFMRRF